jgi:hypothetical protein
MPQPPSGTDAIHELVCEPGCGDRPLYDYGVTDARQHVELGVGDFAAESPGPGGGKDLVMLPYDHRNGHGDLMEAVRNAMAVGQKPERGGNHLPRNDLRPVDETLVPRIAGIVAGSEGHVLHPPA